MTSQTENEKATPLCLPNNCLWDPEEGKFKKTEEKRSYLCVVDEAIEKLRKIKGPVCVVSIAGRYRIGKSYALSKVFDQPDVFPLGHSMDPETMGIWLWIVPEKFKDAKGQEFTVVLLDSEGIGATTGEGLDDNQIFTLTVLLASVLIYNSQGVPTRHDLEGLDFIVKLNDRIKMRSATMQNTRKSHHDSEYFHKTFPYFIWLLRDTMLTLPGDCSNIKDYFLKRVFQVQDSSSVAQESQKVAESILRFFPGFEAFSLPPPTTNPEVIKSINQCDESRIDRSFLSGLEEFKSLLKGILVPKNSFNDGELVTGEALAGLVQLYVHSINDPGVIPNVQSAWEQFVETKCSDVIKDALNAYEDTMSSKLADKLPCDNDRVLEHHAEALGKSEAYFMGETAGISMNRIERLLQRFKESLSDKFNLWQIKNANITREFCNNLLIKLKQQHLDPLLQELKGEEGSKLSFDDIAGGYNMVTNEYHKSAKGAKDVIETVFSELHPALMKEQKQYEGVLRQLKDYDEKLIQELAARALQEEERQKLQEQLKRLLQQNGEIQREMEMLSKKQEEETKQLREQFDNELNAQKEQMNNMKKANMEQAQKVREEFMQENQKLQEEVLKTNKINQVHIKDMERLTNLVAKQEEENGNLRRAQEQSDKEYQEKLDMIEARHREEKEKFFAAQKTNEENKEALAELVAGQKEEMQRIREEMEKAAREGQELSDRMKAKHREEHAQLRREMDNLKEKHKISLNEKDEKIKKLYGVINTVREQLSEYTKSWVFQGIAKSVTGWLPEKCRVM